MDLKWPKIELNRITRTLLNLKMSLKLAQNGQKLNKNQTWTKIRLKLDQNETKIGQKSV